MTDPRDPTAGWGVQVRRNPEPIAEAPKDTGFFGGIGVGYDVAQTGPDTGSNGIRYRTEIYRDLSEQLRKGGYGDFGLTGDAMATLGGNGKDQRSQQFWRALADARAKGLVKGHDDVQDDASLTAAATVRQRGDMEKASLSAERLTGMGKVGSFIGAIGASWDDPETWLTAFIPVGGAAGGAARQIVMTGLKEGAVNAGAALAAEPFVRKEAERLGVERTAGDTAFDVAAQGAFGFAGGAVGKGAHLYLSDRAAVDAFRKVLPEENWTPDERAAVNVMERTEEIAEASPYVRGPAGDHAHFTRVERGMRTAANRIAGVDEAAPVRAVPHPPMATMWKAIIGNEGGTDRQGRFLTSPAGAIGPAQVMPGTAKEAAKLAGLPWDDARYRSDHAYNEAIGQAYFKKQLDTFGDPAKAAAAYNAGPGSARTGKGLRGAMARAARAGEPDNWEKYLPAETRAYVENFRRRTGIEDGPVRPGDMPAMADDIAEPQWSPLPDEPVLPDLRRELFPDEATWRVAQAADEAEMLGVDPRLLIADMDVRPEPVRATVAQDAAPDEGLGPASILTFQPAKGEPGISVRIEDGALATAVFRDADGVARGAVQYPITAEARESFPEVSSFVQPEFRRQGVATRLYDALEQEGYAVDALSGTGDLTPAGAALVNSRRVRRVERAIEAVTAPRAPVERATAPEPAVMRAADAPLPARGAARFDDPKGPAVAEQVMSLGHDIKASLDAGQLDGLSFAASGIIERNGSAVALPESATVILAELDADDAALAAIRGCL